MLKWLPLFLLILAVDPETAARLKVLSTERAMLKGRIQQIDDEHAATEKRLKDGFGCAQPKCNNDYGYSDRTWCPPQSPCELSEDGQFMLKR